MQFYQIHSINCYYIRRYTGKYQRRVFRSFSNQFIPGPGGRHQVMFTSSQAVGFDTGNEYGYTLGVF